MYSPADPQSHGRIGFGRLDSSATRPILLAMLSAPRELKRRVRRFQPCLPRPAKKPPAGSGWIHEIKHAGFRIVAHRDAGGARLVTRSGLEFALRMRNVLAFAIVGALFALT